MTKYDFITELLELFDQIDALKRDNEDLRHALQMQFDSKIDDAAAAEGCKQNGGDFATCDYYALKKGRAEILKDCTYNWKECRAWRNDNGEIAATEFDRWLKEKTSRVPDYMSRKDFAQYFAVELKEMYEEEKADAIARLKEDESEE